METAAGGSESRLQAASRPQTHEDTDRWVGQGAGQTDGVRREAVIEVEVSLQLQKIEWDYFLNGTNYGTKCFWCHFLSSSEKEHDDDDDNGGDEEDDVRGPNEVGGNVGDEEQQAETTSQVRVQPAERLSLIL